MAALPVRPFAGAGRTVTSGQCSALATDVETTAAWGQLEAAAGPGHARAVALWPAAWPGRRAGAGLGGALGSGQACWSAVPAGITVRHAAAHR